VTDQGSSDAGPPLEPLTRSRTLRTMPPARSSLWILWAVLLSFLALDVVLARRLPPPAIPWYDAQTAVVGFVLALASLALAVGSFAVRESLALRHLRSGALDPASAVGFGRLRLMLFVLWGLADLVGAFGVIVAWGSGDPSLLWPYVMGAAALFVVHAPRAWLFERRATA
jgi:hypothetical protein